MVDIGIVTIASMSGEAIMLHNMLQALICLAWVHDQVPSSSSDPVVLVNADLYTVSQGVLKNTSIRLENGKIAAIGVVSEAGAEVIDLSGKRVYPGLIAPLTTMGLEEIGAVRATQDRDEVGDVTPEVTSRTAFNPDSEIIPTVRANGIAVAQVVPSGGLIRGSSSLVVLDGWNINDMALRKDDGMHLSWPNTTVSNSWWMRLSAEEQEKKNRESQQLLDQSMAEAFAYHLAKEAGRLMPTDVRWEAMRPVFRKEKKLFVHANHYRQIQQVLQFSDDYDIDLVLCGGHDAWRLIDGIKSRQIPVILDRTARNPDRVDEDYDLPFRLPQRLYEAGIPFCQSMPGSWSVRNLAWEAGRAVGFGLPQEAALRSVTLSTAEILGVAGRLGSLEVGKDATLIVTSGDILDIRTARVERMYIQGREVDLGNRHKSLSGKYSQRLERAGR